MEEKRKTLTHRKIASIGGTNTKKRHPEHFSQAGHKSWNARAAKNPNAGNELATKGLVARRYKKAEAQARESLLELSVDIPNLEESEMRAYDDLIALFFSGEFTRENMNPIVLFIGGSFFHFAIPHKKKSSFVNSLLGRKTAS